MDGDQFAAWCRREVERRGIPWFGSHANVDGEQIHYVEAGGGDPLVLVHGFLAWSYGWRKNVAALAEDAHVLAPDLRGFGLSEKNPSRPHSISAQAELLRAFLDTKQVDQAVLCGHSMGGEVCLRFALKYPERVRALILVSASGYIRRRARPLEATAARLPWLGAVFMRWAIVNRDYAAGALRVAYRVPEQVTDTDIEAYLLPGRAPGAGRVLLKLVQDMDFGESAARIHEVCHPTLLIWGENDPWVPAAHARRFAQELPNSRLHILPECGHVPPEEHPETFNHLVRTFLHELRG